MSANYGWLQSQDRSQQTRVLFKPGKVWEGYFTNEDILFQTMKVMDILQNNYQSENHVLVFDNMATHLKQVANVLSICKMLKNTPRHGWNWGVEVVVLNGNGKPVFDPNGKVWCQKVHMGDATFADSRLQCLYFPKDHPDSPGVFKGMAIILEECGYSASHPHVECKGFKCPKNATSCCCQLKL